MIKLVIFDLDGTLYDYNLCNQIAEQNLQEKVENEFGIEKNTFYSLYQEAKNKVKETLGNTAAGHNRLLYIQCLCEYVNKNPLKYAMELYNTYWDSMLEQMECFSYVVPLFEKLKEKEIKIGILTDLTAHIQYRKIEKLGIENYIDYIVTSEEVGEEKPSQLMYKTMLKKAGCNADESIMIGDSKYRDIYGAEQMGIRAILYNENEEIIEKVYDLT